MNKQELASKIWAVANGLRGSVSASNYKDYMLGFIFYKFLSNKEEKYLKEQLYYEKTDFDNWIKKSKQEHFEESLSRTELDDIKNVKQNIGYFIFPHNLFSNWIKLGKDFQIMNVRDGLSAFSRHIDEHFLKVYSGIFNALQTGLNSFGTQDSDRSNKIRNLVEFIDEIPVDGKQEYDVLGFVYEFLLKNFAANAGKAGEFYTPFQASEIMSEIIANHLKDRDEISIYDPTSGSGSLLLNIGKSVSKQMNDPNKIKYYAQEWIKETYNLTRMNLIMRGVLPDNIIVRQGDTLADDWPFFSDENQKQRTYTYVQVDAVASNPPYSQSWTTDGMDSDPRFKDYGVAPKSKADYAFLLHNLYHLKSDGIMTIVLPHGVLFRSGEEGEIRKNLVDKHHIETIIGLPANCFYGTGIPTIIMILKKNRISDDILFIDASKGFVKDGNKNRLRNKDVRRIVDTVIKRNPNEKDKKFARLVSFKEIQNNEYNLNIPRYVDSSETDVVHDIYATMFGGIPNTEIDDLQDYWNAFPTLKKQLFKEKDIPYSILNTDNVLETITKNNDVKTFIEQFNNKISSLPAWLKAQLIDKAMELHVNRELNLLASKINLILQGVPLVDYYDAYQILSDEWSKIALDLEIIQSETFECLKKVDSHKVLKKNKNENKYEEIQDGWEGRVLPFDLIQEKYFDEDKKIIENYRNKLMVSENEKNSLLDSIEPDDKQNLLKENSEDIDSDKLKAQIVVVKNKIVDGEIGGLNTYLKFLASSPNKKEKLEFVSKHKDVNWSNIDRNKDGTYSKGNVEKYINELLVTYEFEENGYDKTILEIGKLNAIISDCKSKIKELTPVLENKTKNKIETLTDEEAICLLKEKWINPLLNSLISMPNELISKLEEKVIKLDNKYSITYNDVSENIKVTSQNIYSMIEQLSGNDFDMKGLQEFGKLLVPQKNKKDGGNNNE